MPQRGLVFLAIALLGAGGCQKRSRTNDLQLKPIQEMLDAQAPPGTSEEQVNAFLSSRGYAVLPVQKPGTLAAIIPAAGTQQVTARVIFYFDANHKLNTFELQRAADGPHSQ